MIHHLGLRGNVLFCLKTVNFFFFFLFEDFFGELLCSLRLEHSLITASTPTFDGELIQLFWDLRSS